MPRLEIPDGLQIREPRPREVGPALALVHTPPGPEATGIVGREDWAIAFGQGLQVLGEYRSPGDDVLHCSSMSARDVMSLALHASNA